MKIINITTRRNSETVRYKPKAYGKYTYVGNNLFRIKTKRQ